MADETAPTARYDLRRKARGSEVPDPPVGWRRKVLIPAFVLLVATAIAVAARLHYVATHVKTVRAAVHAAVHSLSPDVDARLMELYVRPGDKVTAGQELARLDGTELQAMLNAAEAGYRVLQSAYAQAQATLELTGKQVEADLDLAAANVDAAAARLASAQAALEVRKGRLPEEINQARALCNESEARLALLRGGPRAETIQAARARLEAAKALEALYELEVSQSQQLVGEGIDSRYILEAKKTQLIIEKQRVEEARLELKRLEDGASEDEIEAVTQALAADRAALALAEVSVKELDTLAADVQIRQAELLQARAERAHAEARRVEIVLADEKVKAAAAELQRAEAQVEARRAALSGTSIRSPLAGTVIRTFGQEGELYRKGVPCILVTDDSRGRWVEGYVRERHALKLRVGQEARVEFIVGSGEKVNATVEAVGLHTASLDRSDADGSASAGGAPAAEHVWVKLLPDKWDDSLLPGNSARAVIRVP